MLVLNPKTSDEPKKGLYSGETKDGAAEGLGKEIFANGNSYQGLYKNGNRHGLGLAVFNSGNSFFVSLKTASGTATFT